MQLRVFLDTARILWPFCLIYFYVRGSLTLENGFSLLRLVPFMAIVFIYGRLLRGECIPKRVAKGTDAER